ncbi:hypothetical protein [Coraliomargarita parva]|uniref:hypothetical protein n=1 Tax=Coraliomargarita parva TaxID=3014050 RepID=UPI0022B374D3|nr:hypothetical protein [Coraliomargarita parva]
MDAQSSGPSQETAQPAEEAEEPAIVRPKDSDSTSQKLINNYLASSGGRKAHKRLLNIEASGTIVEGKTTRQFTLVETRDGKRRLTYTWHHLGRDYKVVRAFDGLVAWEQQQLPKVLPHVILNGQEAQHFKCQRWLIQPFGLPLSPKYVFQYQSTARVNGRPTYLVVGYGPKNERSWFYFDKETSLLIRYGGLGVIGNVKEYMDYRATHFEYVDGVLLPTELSLLVEDSAFGKITFESIKTNQKIDSGIFNQPPDIVPLLRSKHTER